MLNASLRRHCLQRIRDNRVDGASEIAREALGLAAEFAREVRDLRQLRPGMAPIDNLVAHWQQEVADCPAETRDELRLAAVGAAERWSRRSLSAVDRVASHAAALIADGDVILTHSLSSTIGAVFRKLRGRNVQAIAQIGLFSGRADLALVGADSVLADGGVLNKAGTYLLALAARDQARSLYVCAESFKRRRLRAAEVTFEEDDPAAIRAPDLPGVRPRNLPLDLTPARLISAWIDEDGVTLAWPATDDGSTA